MVKSVNKSRNLGGEERK